MADEPLSRNVGSTFRTWPVVFSWLLHIVALAVIFVVYQELRHSAEGPVVYPVFDHLTRLAQSILLVLFLVFADLSFVKRGALFLLGLALIQLDVVMLAFFARYQWNPDAGSFPYVVAPLVHYWTVPYLFIGVTLLPLRLILGTVQRGDPFRAPRLQIGDAMLAITLLACGFACLRFVWTYGGYPNRVAIDYSIWMALLAGCGVGWLVLTLSPYRLGGITLVAIFFVASTAQFRIQMVGLDFPLSYHLTIWTIVAITMLVYRQLGFRLQRGSPTPSP
jgi:hypothetical protein